MHSTGAAQSGSTPVVDSKPEPQIRANMPRDVLKKLSQSGSSRLLLRTCVEWACIVAAMFIAHDLANVWVSLACIVLIATRQHALLALMHEYAHHQLSRKWSLLNDIVGDVLTALPFLITVHGFRRNHMPHHRHASTDQDPNWVATLKKERYHFPKTRLQIYLEIAKHCLGWYTIEDLKGYTVNAGMAVDLPRSVRICRAVYALCLVALVAYFQLWSVVLLYWLLPMATVLMAILYIRDMGEHFGMPRAGIANSRTLNAGVLERLIIAPAGVNYHAEHHLFPAVPYFRLGELHQQLLKDECYREHAVITDGYMTGLLREVSCPPVNPAEQLAAVAG